MGFRLFFWLAPAMDICVHRTENATLVSSDRNNTKQN